MKIFSPELVKLGYYALDKKSCLQEMVDFLFKKEIIVSQQKFLTAILEREKTMSTGIGNNIAIPHARTDSVRKLKVAVYLLDNELEFDTIDSKPVKIIFMIAVPESMHKEYQQLLSNISNFFHDEHNRDRLLKCDDVNEIYQILKGIENEI